MSSRRNLLIRTVTTLCGDIAIGLAMASLCVWLIEVAAFGIFMGFLMWLLAALLSLGLSQYLLHPAVAALLSDRKLDHGIALASGLAAAGAELGHTLWMRARHAVSAA